eukprot:4338572-Prymnesium_polylepis.1
MSLRPLCPNLRAYSKELKRELQYAKACSVLDNVVTLLGVTYVDDDRRPANFALVFEWKKWSLADLILNDGIDWSEK